MTQSFAHAAASRALGCVRGRVEAAATGALENNERLPILWSPSMHSTTLRFLASQTTLPQAGRIPGGTVLRLSLIHI